MSVRCEVDVEGAGPNQKRRSSGVFSSLWSLDEQWSTHTLQKNGWWTEPGPTEPDPCMCSLPHFYLTSFLPLCLFHQHKVKKKQQG